MFVKEKKKQMFSQINLLLAASVHFMMSLVVNRQIAVPVSSQH